jgi:hypothetical protein
MDSLVAQLGHIIIIPSQPTLALSPKCCVLSGEATNTNFKVFGLTRPGLELTSCALIELTISVAINTDVPYDHNGFLEA